MPDSRVCILDQCLVPVRCKDSFKHLLNCISNKFVFIGWVAEPVFKGNANEQGTQAGWKSGDFKGHGLQQRKPSVCTCALKSARP